MEDAGVLSHLCVKVSANPGTADPAVNTRVNAGAGAQTVTLTHAVTGDFEDTLNTDTVTATQKWATQYAAVASASCTIQSISLLFEATTNTVSKNGPYNNATVSTASQTSFGPLGGIISAVLTTETNEKTRIRRAGTITNLMVNVGTNTRAQASTVICRLNGNNGTLTKSITGSTTGIFEDTGAHTDTVAIGDDYNFSIISGTSTGNLNCRLLMVSYNTTNNYGMAIGGDSAGKAQSAALTRMYAYGGFDTTVATTDSVNVQTKACDTFTLSDLTIFVTANSSAASTLTSRKNAGAGSLTASITANTTGVYIDSTNTESDVAADQLNAQLVTGAGTSLTFVELGVWTSQAGAVAATSRPRTVGMNLSKYSGMDLGNEMALGVNNPGSITI